MTLETVAHYRILQKLSSGGMGDVYLAEDTRLHRMVALKLIRASEAEGSQGPVRLLKEAQAAARLDHPNVCGIYEAGESEAGPYIAMQYVDGETLAAILRQARPSTEEVVSWGIQVAEALAEAHARGIIHRDIKPQNLMLTGRGQVKVLDFGLAKVIPRGPATDDSGLMLTTPGMVMGTVPYMSPEQARGEALDGRSDLFSLGAVLFEAAAGRRAFPAQNPADLMTEILLKDPLQDECASAIHPDLRLILARLLVKDRAQRTPSAQGLAQELRQLWERLRGGSGPVAWRPPPGASGPISGPFGTPLSGVEVTGAVPAHSAAWNVPTQAVPASGPAPRQRRLRPWMVALGVLTLVGPAAWIAVPRILAQRAALDSIAVLPFANTTGDPESDYLADGLTEQLINQLSRLPDLKVIARSSVLRYKGKEPDLQALAKELGVKAVLTGRVQQHRDQLSVSVELADAREHRHLWGDSFTRSTKDLLDVQNSIAREISRNLGRTLGPDDQRALASGRIQADPEAYRLYLKGRYYADKWTPEDLGRAMAYFDQALERDPTFALAHVGKANAYWGMSSTFKPAGEVMPKVKEEAQKAIALDPNLAEAHTALGIAQLVLDHDYRGAEASLNQGLRLNPGSSSVLSSLGYFYTTTGRSGEAYRIFKKAIEIDPKSTSTRTFFIISLFFSRNYKECLDETKLLSEIDPGSWWVPFAAAQCYFELGRYPEALKEIEKAEASGSNYALALRGYYLGRLGRKDECRAVLTKLQAREGSAASSYVSPTYVAICYLGLGDLHEVIEWLKRSVELREESVLFLPVNPVWDSVRERPEFKNLIKNAGVITPAK